jgi:hypothetical protein
MSETQALRVSSARTAGASVSASVAGSRGGRGRRASVQLWSLLHAQALLDGAARHKPGARPCRGRPPSQEPPALARAARPRKSRPPS